MNYDIEKASEYWRWLPSGFGKHDSEALMLLSDYQLVDLWWKAFRSRMDETPEDWKFIGQHLAEFSKKRILSIGAGLGFHELMYACFGAKVTVADIVKENLALYGRLSLLIPGDPVTTYLLPAFPAPEKPAHLFDVAYMWGSLHHMTRLAQARLFDRIRDVLKPDGVVVVMSYTWDFVQEHFPGIDSYSFDPEAFGAVADPPTISGMLSPWADYHNDVLLRYIANGIEMLEMGTYNRNRFAWYVFRLIQ